MRKKPPSKSFSSLLISEFLAVSSGKEVVVVGKSVDPKTEYEGGLGVLLGGDDCFLFASAISFRFVAIISRI